MPRILAVDWGERRVGIAISDPSGLLARSLPTLETRSETETVRALQSLVEDEEVVEIVVGLPLRLDGTKGEAAEKAEALAERLRQATNRPVQMWDERLTSVLAERQAREVGERTRGRKGRIDARAAEVLLQSYLDARGRGSSAPKES